MRQGLFLTFITIQTISPNRNGVKIISEKLISFVHILVYQQDNKKVMFKNNLLKLYR